MKIVTVVGARPQFVKASVVSRAIQKHNRNHSGHDLQEVIVHTGQHFDDNMSQVFFDELDIPRPDYNLEISGGMHGAMTGRMLEQIEHVLLEEQPDWLLIYGDTNSTLAGAIAASKLHIPVVHVEAGLRSYNMQMPEEINRILSDRVSTLLFCPTDMAVKNLEAEGMTAGVYQVGDVMYDASLFYREIANQQSNILNEYALTPKAYVLVTCHRAENTDDPCRMAAIVEGFSMLAQNESVVFPLHPRTRMVLTALGLFEKLGNVKILEPVSFLDMIRLESSAKAIITDSGGVQKEACFFGVPCITLRDETEWVETVAMGGNVLVGADAARMAVAYGRIGIGEHRHAVHDMYGDGKASERIVSELARSFG